jgi:hypothetical protein
MAENKEVVEMSEKFLASLFGLTKKWLIDWKLDFQKLFHALQQVSKEGLNGLAEGTHEIKPKATIQKVVTDDDFECIYTSELITIPDMQTVVADVKNLHGDKIGNAPIPEDLKTGIQKRFKIIRNKKNKSSQKIVDRLKQEPGAILSNVFGLRIAEITYLSQLPKDAWIRGIDERDNLSVGVNGDRMVPDACFDSDGSVFRHWNDWGGDWSAGNCFMVLCD